MADFVFADDYVLDSGKTRDFYMTFLKGLVHKNNNIVGVIQGFGSLVLMDEGLDGDSRENVQQMESGARSMTELNKVVLGAAGCGRVEVKETNLLNMFAFHEEKAIKICKDSGVDFKIQSGERLPKVMVDTTKFSEVFENLIKNAAESAATTEQKSVEVEISNDTEDRVDLFIRNSSADIPAEKIPEFFEGFYSSKGADYFGLGLTTAAVLCGQMNIRLGIKCEDSVTTVWLSIPTE